jgi:hypothetical protein
MAFEIINWLQTVGAFIGGLAWCRAEEANKFCICGFTAGTSNVFGQL